MTTQQRGTAKRVIRIDVRHGEAVIYGPARIVPRVLREVGVSWRWDHNWRAITFEMLYVDEVVAALAQACWPVELLVLA